MTSGLRFFAALIAACLMAAAIALAATITARELWPAYAAAEPNKAYTIAMLISRLLVGAICTAGGAGIASIIAQDNRRAACWAGVAFFLLSLPEHLYRAWADYPVWYHVVYLSYLVPVAALTGRALHGRSG